MPYVVYEQTLSRQCRVEVSEEQMVALQNRQSEDNADARDYVVNTAVAALEHEPVVFVMGTCMSEDDEELFDV